MRKQSFAKAAIIASLLILVSCKTTGDYDSTQILIDTPLLSGKQAAQIYLEEYERNEDARLLYNAIYSYIEEGSYDEALALLDQSIGKHPEHLRFLKAKAFALREKGDKGAYLSALEAIYELVPADTDSAALYSRELYDSGNKEKALEVAKDILRRDKNNKEATKILSSEYEFYTIYVDEPEESETPLNPESNKSE